MCLLERARTLSHTNDLHGKLHFLLTLWIFISCLLCFLCIISLSTEFIRKESTKCDIEFATAI